MSAPVINWVSEDLEKDKPIKLSVIQEVLYQVDDMAKASNIYNTLPVHQEDISRWNIISKKSAILDSIDTLDNGKYCASYHGTKYLNDYYATCYSNKSNYDFGFNSENYAGHDLDSD